ncbi:MAG: uroporphyrinogen decarboxylase family protein [Actinomycetota bacterium]|nr:uroporphyrinogen decarboxylase family protein [Actinomycetota bacterium]
MNSRQRVEAVLNHQLPDRVPIDFGSTRTTGITTIAYNQLVRKLGLNEPLPRMYDVVQQLCYPQQPVKDFFKVDAIDAGQAFYSDSNYWKPFILHDGSQCLVPSWLDLVQDQQGTKVFDQQQTLLGIMPPQSYYIDQTYWVYGQMDKFPEHIEASHLARDLWAYTTPPPGNMDLGESSQAQKFRQGIKEMYEQTDYALVLRFGGNLVESGFSTRGMENYFCDLYLDPAGVNRFLETLMEDYLKNLARVLDLAGQYLSVIMFADDMGSEQSPFFSKDIYQKFFKNRHKQMWDLVHSKSSCKVFLHSCGSIYELIPDLIEAGLDVINPVQITARDMQPERLKKEFGRDLIFWGGCCDSRTVLGSGTPEQVRQHVRKNMEILGYGGGLVFNQIHNIQPGVPAENIVAMFEAAYEYGEYK